jgi:hypothetical protein
MSGERWEGATEHLPIRTPPHLHFVELNAVKNNKKVCEHAAQQRGYRVHTCTPVGEGCDGGTAGYTWGGGGGRAVEEVKARPPPPNKVLHEASTECLHTARPTEQAGHTAAVAHCGVALLPQQFVHVHTLHDEVPQALHSVQRRRERQGV